MWIFDPKKPANPHQNLIILDYQCVTNDPVAPSRMRTQSTRNRGDAYTVPHADTPPPGASNHWTRINQ